ncbi:MAG: hypothetical protein HYS12_03105 [Planctomycetes bacterium]|nr:hypothetical protein [Planctomycetota bacterium]
MLHRLVDLGNTVIVVEHNLDVIKTADWVIDLGPEAGDGGGTVVVEGTPEDVVRQWKTGAPSHTAVILAGILEAGPHAQRPKFDPFAAQRPRADDVALEDVGKDAAMPWEADGRRWHTVERITSEGKPARWEGAILDWLDDEIHKLGDLAETNWKHRSTVEIAAPRGERGVSTPRWFLHAMTGQEWLLRLVFRVGRNTFKSGELVKRLGIKPLNETPGLEVYGDQERVWVTNHKGPWQSVTVQVHRLSEIDTPAFRAFLADAVKAFHANIKRAQAKPEDVMPWKVNGERWHLGEKGFPAGRKLKWDRQLLPRLLALVREIEPELVVSWDTRDAITLRVPGVGRGWAQWRTKDADALDCRFLGKKGQFNLSQLEALAVPAELNGQRSEGEVLHLSFQHLEQLRPDRLKEVLAEHLRGFRETFGKAAEEVA